MQAKGALGRRIGWFRGLASSVFVVSIALPAAAADLFVDCREGNPSGSPFTSIADAINSTPTSEPRLDVILRSDCVENVTIQRPHVTIAPEWDRCPSPTSSTGRPAAATSPASESRGRLGRSATSRGPGPPAWPPAPAARPSGSAKTVARRHPRENARSADMITK